MLKMQTVAAQSNHTATIFFLHGLGDCGESWMPVGQMFAAAHPNIKWVFPDAPIQAVTLNSGMRMPAWYDIKSLESKEHQDEQGLYKTVKSVENLVNLEIAAGIPSDRIIVGGFSQGAAVALLTSVMSTIKLGGIIGLSGYLPLDHMVDSLVTNANQNTPVFMAHGNRDFVVQYKWGKGTAEKLQTLNRTVDFRTYSMEHSTCQQELQDLSNFIHKTLR